MSVLWVLGGYEARLLVGRCHDEVDGQDRLSLGWSVGVGMGRAALEVWTRLLPLPPESSLFVFTINPAHTHIDTQTLPLSRSILVSDLNTTNLLASRLCRPSGTNDHPP